MTRWYARALVALLATAASDAPALAQSTPVPTGLSRAVLALPSTITGAVNAVDGRLFGAASRPLSGTGRGILIPRT